MKLIVEVVATNMQTGHVAINQQTLDVLTNYPPKKAREAAKALREELSKRDSTNKVADVLITRNYTIISD